MSDITALRFPEPEIIYEWLISMDEVARGDVAMKYQKIKWGIISNQILLLSNKYLIFNAQLISSLSAYT